MKISKEDFLLLTAIAEFHFKFSEYVRENNEEMFYRAIDYAQTFTNVEGVKFDYWHENNKAFLQELSSLIRKKQTSYDKFIEKLGEGGIDAWMAKKKTNKEDILGIKNYLSNFSRHAKELNYELFDMEDWMNFVYIAKFIKENKFIEFAYNTIKRVLGDEHELLKEFKGE
jgi:uncharacterized protein YbcV (DUF1398 family)